MKALLLYPSRDFDLLRPALPPWKRRDRHADLQQLTPHLRALMEDVELETLLNAMAGADELIFDVARQVLLSCSANDVEIVLHRQDILQDCINNREVVTELYSLALRTIETSRKHYISSLTTLPSSVLYSSVEALEMFTSMLRELRQIADQHSAQFRSKGLTSLFQTLKQEIGDEYFKRVQSHLGALKFRRGVLISANLGTGNEGINYVLRALPDDDRNWVERLFRKGPPGYPIYIHERDEAGWRALSELRDRGINLVANALAQSTEHILSFFELLRNELAFYIGCLNLQENLTRLGMPNCFPEPHQAGSRIVRCRGLYDACLAIRKGNRVVGNDLEADGRDLVMITGANQGGKSTFLRAIGLAQLMMQSGMFVAAESFTCELCTAVFTHYKREEDVTMNRGKLDEELSRLSEIADRIRPNAVVLFNESFASTNEREGSEIARQVVAALIERGIRVVFVTHLYDFARKLFDRGMENALFLRAERAPDGTRTFHVVGGEPLESSFGQDLYHQIFGREREVMRD